MPVLLAVTSLIVWSVMAYHEYDHLKTKLIKDGLRYVAQDMGSLQHEIEFDLSLDKSREAEHALLTRGTNINYRTLVLTDDKARVIYSIQFDLKGLQADAMLPDFELLRFEHLQQLHNADIALSTDDKTIIAYYPVTLMRNEDEIRSLRTGALFLVYDLDADYELAWHEFVHKSELIALMLVAAMFILFLFVHYYFYRPIQHLVSISQALTDGDQDARTNIGGRGELASLGRAFNDMSAQLNQRSRQQQRAENDLRASEKMHRGLIETTAAVAWEMDVETQKFTFMSPQIFQQTGISAEHWTNFQFWEEQLHPEDREKAALYCLEKTASGKDHSFEYRMIRADGKTIWIRDEVSVVTELGQSVALRGYFFDITELKQNEEGLRRSQKMEAVGQLTGGIAHDFNNILNIILGNLNLLEHQLDADEKTQKRLDAIDHSVQRATSLTRQLLSFSRHDVKSEMSTNINNVIESMQTLISQSLTPEVHVEHHLKNDLWLTLIDRGDFEDALVNLSINARDAMYGKGTLTIETSNCVLDESYCKLNPSTVPGHYVQLSMSDTGEGISPDVLEKIFEPFYTTKEQGKGTGLGLSMVFGFVKRSRGSIKVYSELGIGTTFRIYLPRETGKEEVLDAGIPTGEMPHGVETILAVDDEAGLLDLVYETLTDLGYRVLTASNAKQAQEIFDADPDIDLLFSDVVMPGEMNGFELAEHLTAERPQLKVLLTSGYTEKAIAHNGQAKFKANMLVKPYAVADLAQRISSTLTEN